MINITNLEKIIYTTVTFITLSIVFQLLKGYARKTQEKLSLKKSRYFIIKRFISILYLVILTIGTVFIWGINLNNLWVTLTGIMAMIAVAFVAVWSLLGNILSGVLLYFTTPFKIDDTIEILPDNISGKVITINTFFTVLQDENTSYINVPNSLFFQKYIKKITTQKTSEKKKKA